MIKEFFLQLLAVIALIAMPFLSVQPAAAQALPKGGASGSATVVSDKDLNAFVKAYVEYKKIQQAYGPLLEKVQDPQEKQKMAQEANSKVKKAIEKNGLSADKYNRIFTAVNNNPELRKKALKLIDQERKRS